ncbi:MAG TPA: thioredoxin-like domain-containing protein [Candidatus Dormibacteraeota bacterium]|nr:thioredoxin-like domain-containing protein [Candidatus Dormibacteraeota bacterium]
MATSATTARVRAPELRGAGWFNTDRPLTIAGLRGTVVLLDFWTFCCINCLHVIEELRPLEERFGDRLVVIGVHSPKFPHEADHDAVGRAVRRHRIRHPVLDDPGMETWQQYAVRAWPTLVLIDPQGYAVATASGEGHAAEMGALIEQLLSDPEAEISDVPAFAPPPAVEDGVLSYPGKVASDGGSRLAIADTGHDRVLVTDLGGRILDEFGGFDQPQGVRFDGGRLLVCDTLAGRLVAIDLAGGRRTVLAEDISSPWDVVRLDDSRLAVAEAGRHRLLAVPAEGGAATPLAGTRAEGLRDGPALEAHLAQPSGLSVLPGGALAFADSEVSALRVLRAGEVSTLVGEGLFEWGSADGDRQTARLQHPLGVAALPDSALAVADTFNSLLRVWRDGRLSTLALSEALNEPGGLDVLPDGRLVVADTNAHRVVFVDPRTGSVEELRLSDRRGEPLSGRAGETVHLTISLDTGDEDVDPSQGPPVRVTVSADPGTLLGSGPRSWALDDLPAEVDVVLGTPGEGVLSIDLTAATCRGDLCTVHRRGEERPLRVG